MAAAPTIRVISAHRLEGKRFGRADASLFLIIRICIFE